MKFFVLIVIGLLIVNSLQKPEVTSNLRSVVETELAFSHAAEVSGPREAFAAFIADDGVLFRPTAVNGKRWMRENPLPESSKRQLLSWRPIYADISQAGDMAYTTGPWELKQDIKDLKPSAFGNFITVWKKQADGNWKFVIDLGISNPPPSEPIPTWMPAEAKTTKAKFSNSDLDAARVELSKRDWEFANTSDTGGMQKLFLTYAASDLRFFRNDNQPFVGRSAAKNYLEDNKRIWTSQPDFADVSRSGDLGYTYGTYEYRTNDATRQLIGKGNYLRIWKKQNAEWRIVVDVADPLPKK